MKLDSLQAILLAFIFLLPGFVWSSIYAMLIPRRSDTENIRFLEFFTLSSLNNAFWSWLIYLCYRKRLYETHEILAAFFIFLIVFISPVCAALITAKFRQSGWSAQFIDWLGFDAARFTPTAWDYKFSRTGPVWVNVTLQNGNHIYGWFGYDSFAGDAGETGDLYLERTLNGPEENPQERSIWVAADQIAIIEFVEGDNGRRQEV
jgi:hypothetical protein